MIGLALEGGGSKGSYQVGVIKALNDLKIKIDGITGTSIGSLNGALMVSGMTSKLEQFWTNEDITGLLGMTNSKIDDYDFDVKKLTKPVLELINNEGLNISRLHDKLKEIIDEDKIRNSHMDYGLVTYRLNDKKPLYLYKEDIPKGKLVDYILASCFLPVFKSIPLDGDNYYLDGGFYDISPSNMLEDKDYKKIYVISLKSVGVKRKKIGKAKIITISPSRSLGSMFNADKLKIFDNIEMGYYDTIRRLKKLDGYKFTFAKKSKWLYNIHAKKVSKKTLNRAQVFFFTRDNKELIIKALEYVMTKEKYSYGKIYDPFLEITKLRKRKNDQIAYKFLKEIKLL